MYICDMKLLKYLIIYRTTKDPMMAAKIYQMIYHPEIKQTVVSIINEKPLQHVTEPISYVKPTDKKTELLKSLEYLKSKKSPSKQDKESIYTIEMVLKNM